MSTPQYGNNKVNVLEQFYVNGGLRTQTVIETKLVEPFKNLWWKTKFEKAPLPLITQPNGATMFRVIDATAGTTALMGTRSPFSPPTELASEGWAEYTGSLGNFGVKKTLTDQEKLGYKRILENFNGNGVVLKNIIDKYYDLVQSAHSTITNLSAQLLSNGQCTTIDTQGAPFFTGARIEAKQRKTAGAKVWSDPSAKILDYMIDVEKEFRDETNYTGALSWKMDKTAWRFIQKNTDAREQIGTYIKANGTQFTTSSLVTVDSFNEWATEAGVSHIEIVEEKQVLADGSFHRTNVQGWVDGRAVLSPVGNQGYIEYTSVDELGVLGDGSERQLAYLEGGMMGMLNWVESGRNRKYITELLASFAPTLTVFKHIIFVDTKTAD